MVYPGLTANRRIHLGKQGRGNLDVGDSPLVTGGREPGHVAHHAATERNHCAIAREPRLHQSIQDLCKLVEGLEPFSIRQNRDSNVAISQGFLQILEIQGRDRLVADYHHLIPGETGVEQVAADEQSRADEDGVAAGAQIEIQPFHN